MAASRTSRNVAGLSGVLIALEFLTPLRLRRVRQWEDRAFGAALGWFPAIGLLLGIALLLLDRALEQLLPVGPASALLVAALALLSGGLHLDGVADTADGMAVQSDRATRLGVMSEGNIGPAGVMSLALVLLVQWAAIASLAPPLRSAALVLAPALARWAVTPVALAFPPARPKGVGHALQQGLWPSAVPLSTLLAVAAALALFGLPGLVLVLVAGVAALVVGGAAARLLQGVTGDVFGACVEVAQVAVLLACVAALEHGWLEPTFLT